MPTHTITPKEAPAEKKDQKTVITPGGPRLKENTVAVKPGQAVQENAAGEFEVVTAKQNMKTDGKPATATDLVLTPGGYRSSSQVHHVESGAIVDSAKNQ